MTENLTPFQDNGSTRELEILRSLYEQNNEIRILSHDVANIFFLKYHWDTPEIRKLSMESKREKLQTFEDTSLVVRFLESEMGKILLRLQRLERSSSKVFKKRNRSILSRLKGSASLFICLSQLLIDFSWLGCEVEKFLIARLVGINNRFSLLGV